MTKKRRKRRLERIKSVLIVLLSCSALYLAAQTPLPGMWREPAAVSGGSQTPAEEQALAARPLGLSATLPGGGEVQRYGVQYDGAGVDALFQQSYGLLVEAMSSAGAPRAASEDDWRAALTAAPSLCFDWQGELPLSVLKGWLSVENPQLEGTVRRLVLAAMSGKVSLYYQDEGDGAYYVCGSDVVGAARLEEAVASLKDNGARFAFEDEEYSALAPYTLVMSQTPEPAVYTASNPLDSEENQRLLQNALEFPENSVSFTAAGEQVFRNRNDTLRLAVDGTVTYEPASEGSDRYPVSGGGVYPAVEACRRIVQQTLGALGGEAELSLLSAQAAEGGGWQIQFGYVLDGVRVRLEQGGWAARFTVEGGRITGFQLRFRSYADSGAASVVLPQRQAMAAMEAMGHENEELVLVYLDTGADSVSASWAAASELSGGG